MVQEIAFGLSITNIQFSQQQTTQEHRHNILYKNNHGLINWKQNNATFIEQLRTKDFYMSVKQETVCPSLKEINI
jgi:hypothetical protein